MEERFNLLMNPPKVLKVRMIVAALRGVDIDRVPETDGEVRARMRQTRKNKIDWEYGLALKILGGNPGGNE